MRGGNQTLAMLTQMLDGLAKCFETLIPGLPMEITKIYLLQDYGKTPVSVDLVKRKIGGIDTGPILI
jgi:hypothetical protein